MRNGRAASSAIMNPSRNFAACRHGGSSFSPSASRMSRTPNSNSSAAGTMFSRLSRTGVTVRFSRIARSPSHCQSCSGISARIAVHSRAMLVKTEPEAFSPCRSAT